MMIYNKDKHNELVAIAANYRDAVKVNNAALHEMTLSDKDGHDPAIMAKRERLVSEGTHLTNQILINNVDLERMEAFKPPPAGQKDGPTNLLSRMVAQGVNGLEAEEITAMQRSVELFNDGAGDFGTKSVIDDQGRGSASTSMVLGAPIVNAGGWVGDAGSGNTDAGASLPTETRQGLVRTMRAFGGASKAVHLLDTPTGNELRVPNIDTSSERGELLGAELSAVTKLAPGVVGDTKLGAYVLSSKKINISKELIADAPYAIESLAGQILLRRLGTTKNSYLTTGTGTNQPVGLVTSAAIGLTAGAADAVTWQEALELQYEVDPAYLQGFESMNDAGSAVAVGGGMIGYMISYKMEYNLKTLVDGDGRFLWLPSMVSGVPSQIHGMPYVINHDMDAPATGKVPMLFGNFSYYTLRQVMGMQIYIFWDSATAGSYGKDLIGFYRFDGDFCMKADSDSKCESYVKMTMA